MKIKIYIQRKSDLSERFSFICNRYDIDDTLSQISDLVENLDDICISFKTIEEEG